ncbi:MAG: S8 family serine peptidase [Candidatus Nezhaarchaeales archaeon]
MRPPSVRLVGALLIALPLIIAISSMCMMASQPTVQLLLRFRPGVPEDFKKEFLESHGLQTVDYIKQIDVFVVSAPVQRLPSIKSALAESPIIDFVEVDSIIAYSQVPNDPYYPVQWYLAKINCPSAWDISTGRSNIIIAVIDSGVDPTHPDLAGKLIQGWNFYDNNDDTSDAFGHGTRVAGIIAAVTNNNVGIAGVTWNCLILPIKVTNPSGYTTTSLLSKGLVYAADRGAKVAVISYQIFGGSSISSAAKYFVDKGGVVVAAAGNTGKYESYNDNPYIISVSATTSSDTLASYSSYGPYVDLSAPGSGIYTTTRGGGYGAVSGTSFSAPIVAGVAALMLSINPSLTPSQIEQVLESTAVDLGAPGYDVYYGWGRIDAYAALKAALEMTSRSTSPPTIIDTTPPSVRIVYPASGEVVSGSVTVKVEASDNIGVAKVELYKNGNLLAVDYDAPYEFYWDSAADPNGVYLLVARAYDSYGNVGESNAIAVNVVNSLVSNPSDTNPPTVKIVKPLNRQVVSKAVDIVVSASDDSGIGRIEIYVNGNLIATINAEPYTYNWNTRSVKNGWHTITAKVYDIYDNYAETSISVYVYN